MKTITSVEAQNNFGSLMDQAIRGPIIITKHGKPRVIMFSYEDFQINEVLKQKAAQAMNIPEEELSDI
ncbi:type II toxin-antitoxin system Phd/YefM family antitoxin [Candidatus Gracilibacteria bacterium]|nr:type II toxin-antitoxin system Phd/YefM family antitoxin [Candidatus Gracilibacteria bacterium]